MSDIEVEEFLEHFGVKGMKWGKRKAPSRLTSSKSDSSVTRRTKKEYNSLTDKEFFQKHGTTKTRYAKRVNKYGDPYMKSPLAKAGKKLDGSKFGDAAKANVSRSQARAKNRQLNKASRKNDRVQNKADRQKAAAKQAREVDAARGKIASGKLKTDWKAAKAQYKKDKIEIGSREARKIRNKTRDKNYEIIAKAREDRDTKEFVQRMIKVRRSTYV